MGTTDNPNRKWKEVIMGKNPSAKSSLKTSFLLTLARFFLPAFLILIAALIVAIIAAFTSTSPTSLLGASLPDISSNALDNYLKTTPNVYRTGLVFQNPAIDPAGKQVLQVVPLGELRKYHPLQTTSHFNYDYLPPVNSQGSQGSCVAWAVGYYLKTYQENRENNRTDPSQRSQPQNICSPAFIYNLIHLKNDHGAYFSDAFRVINDFGCPSLQEMPYNDHDYQTWPDENDFEGAIKARSLPPSGGEYYWLYLDSESALDQIKQMLLNGDLVVFGIYVYDNYYNIKDYNNIYALADKTGTSHGGHAQTIVGFDDNLVTPDGVGAFRVVNSWGVSWGDSGYYWITYEAIKAGSDYSQGYAYWVNDRVNYDSQKKILFKLEHDYSRETDTWVTVGGNQINFFDFYVKQKDREYQSYPGSLIVLDVKDLASYLQEGAELRLYMRDILTNGTSGNILQFTYQDEENSLVKDSSDPPVIVADATENYASLIIPTIKKAKISLNRNKLIFGANESGLITGTQEIIITNSGEGNMSWTVTPADTWLISEPSSGENSKIIQVSVDPTNLVSGNYSSYLTIISPEASNSPSKLPVELKVMATGGTRGPIGYIDTPGEGATVYGNVPVTGWALDDIEVEKVEIKREPVSGDPAAAIGADGLVYIGDAVFVEGARPDVETAYQGYPLNYRAGWGYMMLTNFLPNSGNGTFTIYAIAYDKEGNRVTLGTKTIICDNANSELPFGTIDTPGQGGVVSGAEYVNFGWALTPQPKYIPYDGSTIWVFVDGVPLGHPVYNNYRVDIATLFPGYANSDGAVGYYYLDTTAYENGVHSIAWSVTDSEGKTEGIGSRYFKVFNSGVGSLGGLMGGKEKGLELKEWRSYEEVAGLNNRRESVYVKKGFTLEGQAREHYPDKEGVVWIEIRELERVAVSLGSDPFWLNRERLNVGKEELRKQGIFFDSETASSENRSVYTGYLRVKDELRRLPIGSRLDSARGVFYWQPGPGFIGEYDLVFLERTSSGEMTKQIIRIKIKPKF